MSWERMKKAREESGGLFIRLKDGDAIEGVFRGEPYCFYQKFKDPNEYTEWAEGRAFKFKINFITRENGAPVAKIFQGGARVRDILLDAIDEYGIDTVFKIKRTGSEKETTRYSILFKTALTPEQLDLINKVELHSLERRLRDEEPPPYEDEEDPFR